MVGPCASSTAPSPTAGSPGSGAAAAGRSAAAYLPRRALAFFALCLGLALLPAGLQVVRVLVVFGLVDGPRWLVALVAYPWLYWTAAAVLFAVAVVRFEPPRSYLPWSYAAQLRERLLAVRSQYLTAVSSPSRTTSKE